ncbi:MAG: hypothetical protein H8M99_07515 [Gloeobacteraceae cyanobacterium ES-bin-144]|nr:hypothetical protein [Verrucomicrobiales bacterium]
MDSAPDISSANPRSTLVDLAERYSGEILRALWLGVSPLIFESENVTAQ